MAQNKTFMVFTTSWIFHSLCWVTESKTSFSFNLFLKLLQNELLPFTRAHRLMKGKFQGFMRFKALQRFMHCIRHQHLNIWGWPFRTRNLLELIPFLGKGRMSVNRIVDLILQCYSVKNTQSKHQKTRLLYTSFMYHAYRYKYNLSGLSNICRKT